jgi:hypothetical protein
MAASALPLLTGGVKILRIQPGFESRANPRPLRVDDREPCGVPAAALIDDRLTEDSLEPKAIALRRGARGAFRLSHFHS